MRQNSISLLRSMWIKLLLRGMELVVVEIALEVAEEIAEEKEVFHRQRGGSVGGKN